MTWIVTGLTCSSRSVATATNDRMNLTISYQSPFIAMGHRKPGAYGHLHHYNAWNKIHHSFWVTFCATVIAVRSCDLVEWVAKIVYGICYHRRAGEPAYDVPHRPHAPMLSPTCRSIAINHIKSASASASAPTAEFIAASITRANLSAWPVVTAFADRTFTFSCRSATRARVRWCAVQLIPIPCDFIGVCFVPPWLCGRIICSSRRASFATKCIVLSRCWPLWSECWWCQETGPAAQGGY